MPYTVTKYPQGTFCWTDVASTNFEATKKFMIGLMNWTAQDMPTPQGPMYTMFYVDGHTVAGGSQMPANMPGVPSMWNNYVTVNNVDEMAAKAVELGAKVAMPTMDVIDVGRMAGIQDPTGAHVMLWQPKKHIGAGLVNTVGAMGWNELYTNDLQKAQDFYAKLFGWTYESMEDMPEYKLIKNNGRLNGGMMAITPEMQGMPPCWMVYFSVKNADESCKKVAELGGKVMMTRTISVGKIAGISDPSGAMFMIMESFNAPDEWVE